MGGELTEQQQAIARLIAAGRTNQQIANELGISRRSVQRHVQTILNKLQLYDRGELALWVKKQRRRRRPKVSRPDTSTS